MYSIRPENLFGGGGSVSSYAWVVVVYPAPRLELGEGWQAWQLRVEEAKTKATRSRDAGREAGSLRAQVRALHTSEGLELPMLVSVVRINQED
jgi:hypothetical protein